MSKHTPGPWYYVGGSDKRAAPYIRKEGDMVPGTMAIASVTGRGGVSESAANARLIAAAPELLAALKQLTGEVTDLERNRVRESAVDAARAAIARAEGK